jgi:hypothetical protein
MGMVFFNTVLDVPKNRWMRLFGQDSGKKKGVKKADLPNSFVFSVARGGIEPPTS